ncbi:dehydration-responsive element-binding protein 1D-like [Nicotiana tabacum]|uniref:Dehydration-responsive element-binding protein 1D-like n=1 Tax=Nicotiana tabacum TaxID=4097 RepID=A0A1S4C9G0_TOBAC|nr:dehydration-responsive element-binding protein 1D-like [Nicotiana tomentosiformis]XP_016497877.1 PREDICTED: dehydration-responsive element-binding protein 1D-like [Nicotiana tabacum]
MDIFRSYYSDSLTESSSLSDNSSSPCNRANLSDEEVLLASNNPKKRAGRKKFHETRHPVYRGVRKRNSDKWVCEMRLPNKKSRIWLGTYPIAEMAARAHDVAAIALRSRSACLNFADSVWKLPIPASTDAKDIQRAAAEAAEAFRPSESETISGESCAGTTPETLENDKFFMDEEALFCMPGFLASMAEGLMLPPPHFVEVGDYVEAADMHLWSYTI